MKTEEEIRAALKICEAYARDSIRQYMEQREPREGEHPMEHIQRFVEQMCDPKKMLYMEMSNIGHAVLKWALEEEFAGAEEFQNLMTRLGYEDVLNGAEVPEVKLDYGQSKTPTQHRHPQSRGRFPNLRPDIPRDRD